MDLTAKRIYVAGAGGMVGSALVRAITATGARDLLCPASGDLDLREQSAVRLFFQQERPDVALLAAARVGGILANSTYRAEFIYDNLMIEANVIDAAYKLNLEKVIFLGSSCIYPRMAPQPLSEESLLTGPLETTNEPYAVAKIAGIKLCESYFRQYGCNFYSVMPTNLYGSNDNFDLESSHVIPGLIRKFHEAKLSGAADVTIRGTGEPLRELWHVDDLAGAVLFLLEKVSAADVYGDGISHINIGSGNEMSVRDLAETIQRIVGFDGKLVFDTSKPDGTPRKFLDSSRIRRMGWAPRISLEEGLRSTYEQFRRAEPSAELSSAAESE